jgi:hypothetical protein
MNFESLLARKKLVTIRTLDRKFAGVDFVGVALKV